MNEQILIDDMGSLYKVQDGKNGCTYHITKEDYEIRKLQYELIKSGTDEKKLMELCDKISSKRYADGVQDQDTEEAYQ